MSPEFLRELLTRVRQGETGVEDALQSLRSLPYEDLGFAKLDHHRQLRTGFPEVVFCQSKTNEQIAAIMKALSAHGGKVLGTRATRENYEAVLAGSPSAIYHDVARIIVIPPTRSEPSNPGLSDRLVGIVSAGTADLPVAEEAAITATEMGSRIQRFYDVGVAGLHRLLDQHSTLCSCTVLVVVAGMEGALASVVGGLVPCPVIAVPTSVGYGANLGGFGALFSMLGSCATGIAVMNIDNGFGAGYYAHLVNSVGVSYLSPCVD